MQFYIFLLLVAIAIVIGGIFHGLFWLGINKPWMFWRIIFISWIVVVLSFLWSMAEALVT